MPEVKYTFVATGGREVAETFRSIENAARSMARATGEADRALARIGGGGGRAGGGRGGPYRSAGAAPANDTAPVRAARSQVAQLISIEEHAARKKLAIARRAEEQRLGLIRSSARSIEREINREEAAAARAARARSAMVGGAARSVGRSILSGAGSLIGMGVDAAGGLVRDSMATQSIANRVSISARKAGEGFIDPNQLRKEFEAAALANPGIRASEVGEAAQKYQELTGDINTARGSLSTFATVASATGAKISDVATAAASIGEQFNVKSAKDMQTVLAALAFQGKEGAIELKDVASQFQRLAAAGAAFGMQKGPEGVAQLGGILQIARKGTGSARGAATAVENIFAGLTAKGGKIPGLRIYDKGGKKRDVNEILADAVTLAGGNSMPAKEAALLKVFGKQGIRGVNPLMGAYRDAAEGKTGKEAQEAGRAAVLKMLQDMAAAGAQWSEIQKDAAQAQQDTGAKLAAAWEMLTAAAGDRLAPAVAELATKIAGNGKVLDLFVGALNAAGIALEGLADFLQKKGLIEGGSASEKGERAAREEARARAEMAALAGPEGERLGKLTPEQRARYDELNARAETAKGTKEKNQAQAAQEAYLLSQIRKSTTQDEADAATDAAMKAAGRSPWTRKVPILGSSDWFLGLGGEDQAARQARHAGEQWNKEHAGGSPMAPQSSARANASGIDADAVAESKAAAAAHKAAAEKLAAAADRLAAAGQRPTITGGVN